MYDENNKLSIPKVAIAVVVSIVLFLVILFGFLAVVKTYSRYQKRADANNNVKVTAIEIRNQEQRVLIAKQKAEIRKQDAIGIREAQDEIAKTLTPMYIAYEMTVAMQAIATSGTNNTVIYIPTNPKNGLPVVPITNQP